MKNAYTIGILAGMAKVNIQTIRYYERRTLLRPAGRTGAGYRLYDKTSLKRLLFIRHAKELGFTLEEIGSLLNLSFENADSCDIVKRKAVDKLSGVEEKIDALGSLKAALKNLIASCGKRGPTESCPILKGFEVSEKKE